MQAKVIRDANAGNCCHTYYKGFAERMDWLVVTRSK